MTALFVLLGIVSVVSMFAGIGIILLIDYIITVRRGL